MNVHWSTAATRQSSTAAHILGLVNTYQHRCLPRCLFDGLYIYDTIKYGLREYRSRALCVIKDPHVHFTIRFAWVSLMLVTAIFFEEASHGIGPCVNDVACAGHIVSPRTITLPARFVRHIQPLSPMNGRYIDMRVLRIACLHV